MSKRCNLAELDKVKEQWGRAYQPASIREQQAWEHDFANAYGDVSYLQVSTTSSGNNIHNMLTVRVMMGVEGSNFEGIQMDIEKVWSSDLAQGLSAHHAFLNTREGFDFQFLALNALNVYISGTVTVQKKSR